MRKLRRVAVFCGSSSGFASHYATAAVDLGRELARREIGLVYGGGRTGLMGVLADSVLAAGGTVTGVMPSPLIAREIGHTGLSDFREVGSMHERKALMADLSDAFIAMPGGFGTLDEFCEAVTWTQLGIQAKPCGLLNIDGFFDAFLAFIGHARTEGFIKQEHLNMVQSSRDPGVLLEQLAEYVVPLTGKWVDLPVLMVAEPNDSGL